MMLQCSPCGKYFTGKENYNQHIVSDKHKRKVLHLCPLRKQSGVSDDLTDGVATSKPESDDFKCKVCNIFFDTFENFYRHSVTLEHALKVEQETSNGNLHCNVTSTTNLNNYEVHRSSNDTKHDDEIVAGFDSDYISRQCSTYKSCGVCNKNFSGPEPYKQHIESENHKKKAQLQRNSLVGCTTNSYSHELHNTENELAAEFKIVNTRSQYLSCDVCKKDFTGPEPYKQHNESEIHKKKVELQKNSSVSGINISITSYSCKTCDKTFNGEVPYKQHMESEKHKKKYLHHSQPVQHFQSDMGFPPEQPEKKEVDHINDFNPWFCQVCKIQCTGLAPYGQHLRGSAHIKKSVAQGRNNELKSDVNKIQPIQESNFNANGILTILDNTPKLLNGSIQKNNEKMDEDILIPKIGIELKAMDTDELEQSIKIFLPDEKINFDQLYSAHEDDNHEETNQIKKKSKLSIY